AADSQSPSDTFRPTQFTNGYFPAGEGTRRRPLIVGPVVFRAGAGRGERRPVGVTVSRAGGTRRESVSSQGTYEAMTLVVRRRRWVSVSSDRGGPRGSRRAVRCPRGGACDRSRFRTACAGAPNERRSGPCARGRRRPRRSR